MTLCLSISNLIDDMSFKGVVIGSMNQGECLCGEVKFEVNAEPRWVGACHCRMCQRQSGGAMQVWVQFLKSDFKLKSGNVKKYVSSANVVRSSCSNCSTHLFFEYIDNPDDFYVCAPALSGPDLKPELHIWWNSRLNWLCFSDDISTRPN